MKKHRKSASILTKVSKWLVLLMVGILLTIGNARADVSMLPYRSHIYTSDNGLPGNGVYSMLQDAEGYVWMGTLDGLARFDGYSFVPVAVGAHADPNERPGHIGYVFGDLEHHRMWVTTAILTVNCYDLDKRQFVDYTGRNDEQRQFEWFRLLGSGMWMWDKTFGLRHVACLPDGNMQTTDYTRENGQLPSDNVTQIADDGLKGIWLSTDHGLCHIDSLGNCRTMLEGRNLLAVKLWRSKVLCLTDESHVITLTVAGQQEAEIALSAQMGHIDRLSTDIMWQGHWLIFTTDACYEYDTEHRTFLRPADMQLQNTLDQECNVPGYQFVADRSGKLWIFPDEGEMKVLNLIDNPKFTNEKRHIFFPAIDSQGVLWIGTYCNGLYSYNIRTGEIHHFSAFDPEPLIPANYLLCVTIDQDDNIWVGTENAGVACILSARNGIGRHVALMPNASTEWDNYVRHVVRNSVNGQLLISTRGDELFTYDEATDKVTHLKTINASVYATAMDRMGHEWIGTRGDGLYVNGVHYTMKDAIHHVPINDFFDLQCDSLGRMWLATWDGGLLLCRNTDQEPLQFEPILQGNVNLNRIDDLDLDPDGILWIGTYDGLYQVDTHLTNPSQKDVHKCPFEEPYADYAAIFCLRYTSKGYLWAGLKSSILRCTLDKDHHITAIDAITRANGLADDNVYSIEEDDYGFLWVSTGSSLSRIDQQTLYTNNLRFSQKLRENSYIINSSVKLTNGHFVFGTIDGLMVISPEDALDIQQASNRLSITNIDYANERSVEFTFSNFDYSRIEDATYQFYLEGVESNWREPTSVSHISYNGLTPGHYVFHLRTKCQNGWSDEKIVRVDIPEPFYNTWWAWLIYLVLAALIAWYVYTNWKERFKLHQQMYLEQEQYDFRLRFFTHITHEFRTPLAIIVGAVDKMKELRDEGNNIPRSLLLSARRGTQRLNRLVTELMQFRKVSTDNMRLHVSEGNIVELLQNICQDVSSVTQQKQLKLSFTSFEKAYRMTFDKDVVEHVFYNLLSNAVKYTQEQGHINVTLDKGKTDAEGQLLTLVIRVEDDGPGIDPKHLSHLYEPFMHGYASQGGMGIGLYMAHSMAQVHHGELKYEQVNPHGCRFTFTLPAIDEYSPDEHEATTSTAVIAPEDQKAREEMAAMVKDVRPEVLNDCTVVVIEDDPDMMDQIKTELSVYFHVEGFMTGESGMEGIERMKPSLVICDVMLPDHNGYEIVRKLKGQAETMFIPVIMLTALDDDVHQIRGYEAGADDYLTKPCNYNLLIVRAVQLIRWQRQQRQQPSMTQSVEPSVVVNKTEKKLMEEMNALIAEHISDPEFTIDQLANMLCMGRTRFYGKVKELTGLSPNNYLLNERMRIAAELLQSGKYTVAEVSTHVGILNASYFVKRFKEQYGILPSKFAK